MLIEGEAGSIGELVQEAERIRREFKPDDNDREEIWYRGQNVASHPLTPTLYRNEAKAFHYDELTLMDRFEALAAPLVGRRPARPLEWYFLARHHGLPSRLLDWSESLLTAAYFAIAPDFPKNRLKLDELCRLGVGPMSRQKCEWPVVWILEAGSLNLWSLGRDGIVTPGGRTSRRYLPEKLRTISAENEKPIGIYPPRTNARVAAQHGTFTLHGHSECALDEVAKAVPSVRLGRVAIDIRMVYKMCADLRVMGMHQLAVYQDLDSVARHIYWTMQSSKP